jgi:hypothetical protein
MPKRRIEDSDDDDPIFAERRAKKLVEKIARLEDSDDDNSNMVRQISRAIAFLPTNTFKGAPPILEMQKVVFRALRL